jgi:hypothetical protein
MGNQIRIRAFGFRLRPATSAGQPAWRRLKQDPAGVGNPHAAPAPPSQAVASWRETPRRRCLQNNQIPVFTGPPAQIAGNYRPMDISAMRPSNSP